MYSPSWDIYHHNSQRFKIRSYVIFLIYNKSESKFGTRRYRGHEKGVKCKCRESRHFGEASLLQAILIQKPSKTNVNPQGYGSCSVKYNNRELRYLAEVFKYEEPHVNAPDGIYLGARNMNKKSLVYFILHEREIIQTCNFPHSTLSVKRSPL